jgi:hypothetical protein
VGLPQTGRTGDAWTPEEGMSPSLVRSSRLKVVTSHPAFIAAKTITRPTNRVPPKTSNRMGPLPPNGWTPEQPLSWLSTCPVPKLVTHAVAWCFVGTHHQPLITGRVSC